MSAARSSRLLATLDVPRRLDRRARETSSRRDAARRRTSTRCASSRSRPRSRAAPPGAFYLVLTHSHDLDLRITEAILRRGDFGFLGLIGSRTKRARFVHRFEQRGIAPERWRA